MQQHRLALDLPDTCFHLRNAFDARDYQSTPLPAIGSSGCRSPAVCFSQLGYKTGLSGYDNIADIGRVCNQGNMSGSTNFESLMHDVCVGQGWCGGTVDGKPAHVDDFIPESGQVTAEQFVDWLFRAEGLDPLVNLETCQRHKDSLKDAFVRHMGADVVDASMLKWSLD
jgi:hypothetical protein